MQKKVTRWIFVLCLFATLGITGCGGGDGAGTALSPSTALTGFGWLFDNGAPDYANNGATCLLNVALYYSSSVSADEIDSFVVTAPNGWRWSSSAPAIAFSTSSSGQPFINAHVWYGANPQAFPLAGEWTATIKLKNGATSSLHRSFHEPGSATSATHAFLFTKEDLTPSPDASQYVAALARFPSSGYSVHYSSANGARITTSGLSAVRGSYLASEPNAYNFFCWLYDANKTYLGHTTTEYSSVDHSPSSIIGADGELALIPAATSSLTNGTVDLSQVKYLRFVYLDGAQYAPASYSSTDYRSISALVPVN